MLSKALSKRFAVLVCGLMLASVQNAYAGKVVFSSNRAGSNDIYIMNDDGSDQRVAIDADWSAFWPALSYDNKNIAYSSRAFPSEGRDLFVANADGTGARQLTSGGGYYSAPSWSPDGKQIVFMGYHPSPYSEGIYIINSDGTNLRLLADIAAEDLFPVWSPDGKKIVFVGSDTTNLDASSVNTIYTISPDGSNLKAITGAGGYSYPSWSPDSRKILFSLDSTTGNSAAALALMNTDGTNPVILHQGWSTYNWPHFLENGRIAFGVPAQIYSINANGSDQRALTTDSSQNIHLNTAFNIAPSAVSQTVTTDENTAVDFTLQASDSNGDTLEYSLVTAPQHGTLSGTAPSLRYTPSTGFNGDDSFSYRVGDGKLSSNIAVVHLTVNGFNDAPVATPQQLETNEDTALPITLSGTDAEGNVLKYVIQSWPQNGVITGEESKLIYTPFANFNGDDSFKFEVFDGQEFSAAATVHIKVHPVNDTPIANSGNTTTWENTPVDISLLATDVDGDTLIYSIVSPPSKGTLSGTGAQRIYTPQANFSGTDSFSFRVSDGSGQSAIATVTISVDAHMPIASDDSYSLDMRPKIAPSKLSVAKPGVLSNDNDDDTLSATLVSPPAKGKLKLNRDGSFTFTPPNAKTATYTFTYRASDGQHSDTATVIISIIGKSQR